ncbi:phasin family protein [Bradyrhizobium sp. ARR65]|uniref:phasin family protein n=1 Tax=Bradyrhizobium sp. ARR65 TaxID=1040989 RepID=UPI0004663769|nr:phasin family protein [Bradyrhizobium sp. ARR65]
MARQEDKSTQDPEGVARATSEQIAEQPRRMVRAAAEATEEVAKASANLLQQNAELLRNSWRFGLDTTTAIMGRSTEQVSRTLGLSGNEAQQATERSARNTETLLYSATAASKCMSGLSQEYFEFVRRQLETSMERINELWRCRSPQDVAAVQSDLMRDTLGSVLESSRRMADISLKLTDDAATHMTQNLERMKRAA